MSKHTRGPWSLADRGDYNDFEAESRVVFGTGKRLAVVHHHGDKEAEANANLIAAAPDLLDATKVLLSDHLDQHGERVCDCQPEPQNVGHLCSACRARAAIAKAEGRDL